jgi:hypothetical protein
MTPFNPPQDVAGVLAALSVERWPVARAGEHIQPVPGL